MTKRIEYSSGERLEGTRLVFMKYVPSDTNASKALFLCDCGEEKIINTSCVRRKTTRSCGCLNRERATKHSLYGDPLYKTYMGMIRRCVNPKDPAYKHYGGRGIKVCDRWLCKENGLRSFLQDMGDKPCGMSLDRIDVDGNYTPENCRWASGGEQNYNKRLLKRNSTGKTGVYKRVEHGKTYYVAVITVKKKTMYLMRSQCLEEAVEARKAAEIKFYGYHPDEKQTGEDDD